MPQRILSVEDHPLFADALLFNLRALQPALEVLHSPTLRGAREVVAAHADLDLILLDLCLPDARGLEALIELRRLCARSPILVLSAYCDETTITRGMHFGAAGFISKGAPKDALLHAVTHILSGHSLVEDKRATIGHGDDRAVELVKRFSPQQVRVVQLICQGLLNKQIAHRLEVSEATIKCHVGEIMQKLGVSTRTQVVAEISRSNFCQILASENGEP